MSKKEENKKEEKLSPNPTLNQSRRSFIKGSVASAGAGLAISGMSGMASAATESQTEVDTDGKTMLKDVIARPDLWFYPGEELDANEMRVTLMGTGWGNIIRHNQKGASIYVELGNGESFLFDVGPGCGINYNTMQVPASRMTKIFLTHLHMDHTSDLAWMYAFGPASDRYTPLRVWGPSGTEPKLGTKANIEGIRTMTQWHRPSFETCLDVGDSYKLEITELDYRKNTGIAYQENGVTIRHWPALHIMDGAISYRLDWNGLSMVWTGDTQPNHFTAENAKGVDVLIHETAPTAQRYSEATGLPLEAAKIVVKNSHTPAKALGKVFQIANPRLGVTSHCPVDPQEMQGFYDGVRSHWDGQYQVGEDLMVFNISTDKILIRKGGIQEYAWQPNVLKPNSNKPTLNVKDYQTGIFDKAITKY